MGKHSAGKRDSIMAPSRFDLQVRLAASQATSMASRRRTTRNIGAAACGLTRLGLPPVNCRPCLLGRGRGSRGRFIQRHLTPAWRGEWSIG